MTSFTPLNHVIYGRQFIDSVKPKDEETVRQLFYLENTLTSMEKAFKKLPDVANAYDLNTHYLEVMGKDWVEWSQKEEREESPTPNPQAGWKTKGQRHHRSNKEARKIKKQDKKDRKRQRLEG